MWKRARGRLPSLSTNPTGTVALLTYRTADALQERYFKSPGELLEWTAS